MPSEFTVDTDVQFSIPLTKKAVAAARRAELAARPRVTKLALISLPCANCDEEFVPWKSTLRYCSLGCHDEAKAVRYIRAKLAEYSCTEVAALPDDIEQAIYYKVWWAVMGGYDERGRRHISLERRAEVHSRDQGLCVICGQPGAEVDHMHSDSDKLQDLRLLCDPCHNEVTTAHLSPLNEPWQIEAQELLMARVFADPPTRDCDSADWHRLWRDWAKAHGTWA